MKFPLFAPRRRSGTSLRLRPRLALSAAAPLALLAACASPPAPSAAPAAATAAPTATGAANQPADPNSPVHKLAKGLTAAEVRARLGAPLEIKTQPAAGLVSEIWLYERALPGRPRQVAADMREIPFVDPISGQMRMIKEPIYKTEQTSITERTELLMIRGLLVEWRQTYTSNTRYY